LIPGTELNKRIAVQKETEKTQKDQEELSGFIAGSTDEIQAKKRKVDE